MCKVDIYLILRLRASLNGAHSAPTLPSSNPTHPWGPGVSLELGFSTSVSCHLGLEILCCPFQGPLSVFSSISGLYALNAVAPLPPVLTTKNASTHCQMSPGGKNHTHLGPQLWNITWQISAVSHVAQGAQGVFRWTELDGFGERTLMISTRTQTHLSLSLFGGFLVFPAETTSPFKVSVSFLSDSREGHPGHLPGYPGI